MANFASELGTGLKNRLVPDETSLDRKIDFQREKFLKGLRSTRSGKKEDPTYISFRFIFDFGNTGLLEEETFLPISPLFRKKDLSGSEQFNALNVPGSYTTSMDFFYGSKLKSEQGRKSLFAINGGVGYLGAQSFLSTRSEKRAEMIRAFGSGWEYINKNSPWYFQSVSGLDKLVSASVPRYGKPGGKIMRSGELTINCLESIDMRISALAELYRKAIYDYTHHRVMLPENLRKFRMWIVVTEIRNIQMDFNMSDVLNPFSVPAVAKIANVLSDFNSQTGLLDSTEKFLNKSTRPDQATGVDPIESSRYNLQPYVYIYQLDQCEFDFDSTYPSFETINNAGGQMVSTSFKIHVGRVKDYKIQFNELNEYKEDNGIKGMVLSDVWGGANNGYTLMDYDKTRKRDHAHGQRNNGYTLMDYDKTSGLEKLTFSDKANPGDYFAQLASNFVTNTVSTLKNEAVSFLESKLLGNIYGFQPGQLTQSTNDAFSLVNGLKSGVPNPFKSADPQSTGLGGPGQRQYPRVNDDVYLTVPENPAQNLGNVLGPGAPSGPLGPNDIYGNVPGSDLGLPDRTYPSNNSDEYSGVPGQDLGLPGRVYQQPSNDVYQGVPGSDLGLPDRTYQANNDDEYNQVPGTDLGVPNRVYTTVNSDQYSGVPGSDLGLPSRSYPSNNADEFSDVPGADLGVPGRTYPIPTGDSYADVPGVDLGLPTRTYPSNTADEYSDVPGADLGLPGRVYVQPNIDEYVDVPGPDLGLPDRSYPPSIGDEYSDVPEQDLGLPGRVYNQPTGDAYGNVPGTDLGLPDRAYQSSIADEYVGVPESDLGVPLRVYPETSEDVYDGVTGSNLGLPDRQYPGLNTDEFASVPGNDLGAPNRVYSQPNEDTYVGVPGNDLGLPAREYPNSFSDEYNDVPGNSLEAPSRIYQKPVEDAYQNVPGSDLGLPDRLYGEIDANEYSLAMSSVRGNLGRVYPNSGT